MAHLVAWTKTIFFYAMGNTPAVCLTSELPPEQSADILLLGCGDVRNVLYTVYADLGAPSRPLDFTCCDIDPAILARNILLYTLLADLPSGRSDEYLQNIWNFYYHFLIDKGTLDMVLKQSQALVDLSPDIATWNNGKYGSFIRFSSLHSLSTIRKHWTLYVGTKDFSKSEMESLRTEIRLKSYPKSTDDKDVGFNLTSIRSAGPLWKEMMELGPKHFRHYWETGVTFDEPGKLAKAKEVNPTFVYSAMGKGFALHYGSDPILSFHLAKTLAPVSGSSRSDKTVTVSGLVMGAMEEFKSWCLAFNRRLKGEASLVIRFLVGDVISVCRALHFCAVNGSVDPGLYIMPWSTTLLKLDGGDYVENASNCAPLQFNAIDTSNLTDHIGLLNILVPCRPLMQMIPSSVIFTNTLISDSRDDGLARDGFPELLCGDLSVLSMILDLIPVSFISNFSSHCNSHEMISFVSDSPLKQLHKHIAWRIGTLSDSMAIAEGVLSDQRLKFDEEQLANFFYGVYLNMFRNEDLGSMLQRNSPQDLQKYIKTHYSRFALAYVLRLVKDRVDVNWEGVMGRIHDLIAYDQKLILGSNNLQDLFCSLHLLGAHSFPTFSLNMNANVKEGPLARWKSIPPVVCIIFQVPRKRIGVLEKFDKNEIGTPVLLCSLKGASTHNMFPTYQSFWGKVKAEYGEDLSREPKVTFEEDPEGFRGSSPAVFTFYVPAWMLGVNGPQEAMLSVQSNVSTIRTLLPVLGPSLTLFSAGLTDRRHVHITQERPGNPGELQKLRSVSFAQPTVQGMRSLSNPVKVALNSASRQVAFFTGRANIEDVNAKISLANGAAVSISQISPRVVQISIGSHLQTIAYPFPIDSTDSKTRIARKSSYVEVDVKISGPLEKLGTSLKPFPVIVQDKALSLWNIHYIDLERLPELDVSSSNRLSFLTVHLGLSYSDRERHLCAAETQGKVKALDLDVITRVKQSIHHLVVNGSGLKKERHSIVGLTDPENGGVYTLIFINAVRLDLASHTVMIDACVLPLTVDLVSRLVDAIGRVGEAAGMMQTLTKPDEVKAWKHLLPAFTERCRKWSHTANCEYLSKGVPVSEEIDQSPLCSCGRGKNLGSFVKKKQWKEFAPYVTRAAISPLFAVPFVDSIGGDLMNLFRGGGPDRDVQKNVCANCRGPGKPKLLACGACKNANYCSESCQKADWKVHKKSCKKV